jgi:hypothetical protein
MLQERAKQKAEIKKRREQKLFTIDCYYRLLSGFLVAFTTTITIVEKVSFAIPWHTLCSDQTKSKQEWEIVQLYCALLHCTTVH